MKPVERNTHIKGRDQCIVRFPSWTELATFMLGIWIFAKLKSITILKEWVLQTEKSSLVKKGPGLWSK